jgi:outer membrane protein assembly factor BamE (lipoprotein component of BamABCDE complex)
MKPSVHRRSSIRTRKWAISIHPSAIAFLILALLSGCSLYFETKRPDYTDVTKVQKGTPRYDVTAALGKPIESYKHDGKDIDVFQADPNGRYAGTKTAVTAFNTVADVFTIGMWEVVATPAEMLTKHKLTTYVVTYAPDQTVESIETVAALPKPVEQAAAANPPTPSSGLATPEESASPTASPIAAASPAERASPAAAATP